MLLCTEDLRERISRYIQRTPTGTVPAGEAMQLVGELATMKRFGKPPAAVPNPEEGPAVPGGKEKDASDG